MTLGGVDEAKLEGKQVTYIPLAKEAHVRSLTLTASCSDDIPHTTEKTVGILAT